MKLIIERVKGEFYAFSLHERHYKVIKDKDVDLGGLRGRAKIDPGVLADECNIERNKSIPPYDDFYMVFNLKR